MVTRASGAFTRWLAVLAAATIIFSGAGVITAAQAVAAPTVEATAIPAGGGTVTITGKGFSTEEPGFYVVVAKAGYAGLYDAYEAGEFTRTEGVWVSSGVETSLGGAVQMLKLNADGTFTLPLTVKGEGDLAVYTSKAHGAGKTDTSQDTVTPLTRSDTPEAPEPTVTKPSLEVTPAPVGGGEITVTGRNFIPDGVGVLVIVGPASTTDLYTGSQKDELDFHKATHVAKGMPAAEINEEFMVPTQPMGEDGTFSFTLKVPAEGDWAVFSSLANGQGAKNKSQDVKVLIPRAGETQPEPTATSTPEPNETSVPEPAEALDPMTGDLTWGVRESFRKYISGPIAKGTVELDGAVKSGDLYSFPARDGRIDEKSGLGTYRYSGSVRFTGHAGMLDLKISDPEITQTDANSADLIATVVSKSMSGELVDFGRVALGSVTTETAVGKDGRITVSKAPVALTETGSKAFAGFYASGADMDPVDFTAAVTPAASPSPSPAPTETSSPEPTETSSPEPTETSSPEPTETSVPEETEPAATDDPSDQPVAGEGNPPAGEQPNTGQPNTAQPKTGAGSGSSTARSTNTSTAGPAATSDLPVTGADGTTALTAGAAALLLIGGLLVAASRRREKNDELV